MEFKNINALNNALSAATPEVSWSQGVKIKLNVDGKAEFVTRNAIVQLANSLKKNGAELKDFSDRIKALDTLVENELKGKNWITKLLTSVRQLLGNRNFDRKAVLGAMTAIEDPSTEKERENPIKNPSTEQGDKEARGVGSEKGPTKRQQVRDIQMTLFKLFQMNLNLDDVMKVVGLEKLDLVAANMREIRDAFFETANYANVRPKRYIIIEGGNKAEYENASQQKSSSPELEAIKKKMIQYILEGNDTKDAFKKEGDAIIFEPR